MCTDRYYENSLIDNMKTALSHNTNNYHFILFLIVRLNIFVALFRDLLLLYSLYNNVAIDKIIAAEISIDLISTHEQ
jgi:hypothetical protein